MEILFKNSKTKKMFDSEKAIKKNFGTDARTIMKRLAFLDNAPTLNDVPIEKPFRRHEHVGNRKGQFSVDINENRRLFMKPGNEPIPKKEDGGIDLKAVTSIIIIGVEDPH